MDAPPPGQRTSVIALALVLLATDHGAAQSSVLLQPTYVPGRSTYEEQQADLWFNVSGGPLGEEGIEVYTGLTLGLVQTVESSSNERVRLRLTFSRVAAKLQAPMFVPVGWDTDGVDPPQGTPALGRVLQTMLGKSYTVELNAEHRVTAVEGLDAIRAPLQEAEQSLPAVTPILLILDRESIEREWGEHKLVLYPMRRVKVGESWTRTITEDLGGGGVLLVNYTCTLREISGAHGHRLASG